MSKSPTSKKAPSRKTTPRKKTTAKKPFARSAKRKPTNDNSRVKKTEKRNAVFLTLGNTDPIVLEKVKGFCKESGYDVTVLDLEGAKGNPDNIYKAVEMVQQGPREKSVCYIGGAREGKDKDLVRAVQETAAAVSEAGFNTVYPGSCSGVMGVLARAVLGQGNKLTSVFSLDVAQAHIEELERNASSMVIAPNENVRQVLYHLLSGAQIALPGGTGTKTEATAHFYQNGQMGIIYRNPMSFGPENFPSPIIYLSPNTPMVEQEIKRQIAEKIPDPDLKSQFLQADIPFNYWDGEKFTLEQQLKLGFAGPESAALIKFANNSDEVVKQLQDWDSPEVREMLIKGVNVHHERNRKAFQNIMG